MKNVVVVLRGLTGRDLIIGKTMDLLGGYRLLDSRIDLLLPSRPIPGGEGWASYFSRPIKSDILQYRFPELAQDISRTLDSWGDSGSLNPFDRIYELVFSVVARVLLCPEIYDDPQKTKALMKVFRVMEQGSDPSALILPWLPTPTRLSRAIAWIKFHFMIKEVVDSRKKTGRREDDLLQTLIDQSWSVLDCTRFMAMLLFAAGVNSITVVSWLVVYIHLNPSWRDKIQSNVDEWISEYGNPNDPYYLQRGTLMEDLEAGVPIIEQCVSETIRFVLIGTFTRINLADDLKVEGHHLAKGTFVMYPIVDLHFDEEIYPNPHVWDPSRYSEDQQAERTEKFGLTFLGWGAGRHPCTGKRFAILLMKLIVIMIMSKYDAKIVDEKMVPLERVPKMRFNLLKSADPGEELYLRYERRRS